MTIYRYLRNWFGFNCLSSLRLNPVCLKIIQKPFTIAKLNKFVYPGHLIMFLKVLKFQNMFLLLNLIRCRCRADFFATKKMHRCTQVKNPGDPNFSLFCIFIYFHIYLTHYPTPSLCASME
jgi:hypothetical protein